MKVSFTLAALGAALTMAAPLDARQDVVIITEIVTKYTTVDPVAAPTNVRAFNKAGLHRVKTRTIPPAPPAQVTQPPPPPPPASTPAPAVKEPEPSPVAAAPAPVFKEVEKVVEKPKEDPPKVVEVPQVPAPKPAETENKQETAASSPAAAPADFQSAALYHHNIHRANHSVDALSWSASLASSAATVASSCIFEHNMGVDGGKYGQNLAMMGGTEFSANPTDADNIKAIGQSVTNMWYNGEFGLYNFGPSGPNTGNFMGWGHLSQVLWKATTEVGCAVQHCKPGTKIAGPKNHAWFAVCNYKSQGNFNNAYVQNVLPPTGKATVTA